MSNTAFSKMATSSGAVRHGCWARNAIPLLSSLGAKGQPECNKLGRPKYSPPQGEQQCMPPMLLNAPRTEQRRRSRRGKILERRRPGRSREGFQRGDSFRWPDLSRQAARPLYARRWRLERIARLAGAYHAAFKLGLAAIPRLGEPVLLEPIYRGFLADSDLVRQCPAA